MYDSFAPVLDWILKVLSAISGAWTLFHITKAGIAMMSSTSKNKEEGMRQLKFVIIGGLVSLGTYFLSDLIYALASGASSTAGSFSGASSGGGLMNTTSNNTLDLHQQDNSNQVIQWVIGALTAGIDYLMDNISALLWLFTGGRGQNAMIMDNIVSPTNSYVMGMYPQQTWNAIMTVQHTLTWVVAASALIYFIIQGMRIQASPNSIVAKERVGDVGKSIFITAVLLVATPYLLGITTSASSAFAYSIAEKSAISTGPSAGALSNTAAFGALVFDTNPVTVGAFLAMQMLSGHDASFANSLFRLIYSTVNVLSSIMYLWRKVFLAIWICIMPLSMIGLFTGKNKAFYIHWWKEYLAYLLIPCIASLMLWISKIFIGL